MKTTRFFVSSLLIGLFLGSCQKNDEGQQPDCQPPTTLVAKAPCESGYQGAQLIASNYAGGTEMQFIYNIFVQKDTLSSDLIKSSYVNASNERIIISETVLKDAPKFVVQVSVNCNGKDRPSKYSPLLNDPLQMQDATFGHCRISRSGGILYRVIIKDRYQHNYG